MSQPHRASDSVGASQRDTRAVALPDDIIQLQIPLPFTLNIVNCYLLRDGDGWTLIDTGLVWEQSISAWEAAFAAHAIRPRDLRRLIVTHHHPDHVGMAGWLQRRARADGGTPPPVIMTAHEAALVRDVWIDPAAQPANDRDALIDAEMRACAAPPELTAVIRAGIAFTRAMTLPHPLTEIETVASGATLQLGTRRLTVSAQSGHSDAQMLLYDADDALIFCADHVLMRITPNIGIWPETAPHPLTRYLASLRELRDWNVRLGLPGHKALITDWRGRIDALLAHHDARLAATMTAVAAGNTTVYDVARVMFDFSRFTQHDMRFAMVETLAHLDHLAHVGALLAEQVDGVWVYSAARRTGG
ncbi:MAG: MBL fold metallo-hydrolase [Chloroflexota bacterium]|nr:MBL fold metallo-hydrolase [Chloroflexota bacterium]